MRHIEMNEKIIDPDWSVNATIQRFPSTVAVFNQYGVDACCGGAATLREAALDAGVAVDQLLDALESAAAATAIAS
jgi:regulator of cell morphogenesis and NO signaling